MSKLVAGCPSRECGFRRAQVRQVSTTRLVNQQYNSEVWENRHSEHTASCLEQHDADVCDLTLCSRNLFELQDLDMDLRLLLLLKILVDSVA